MRRRNDPWDKPWVSVAAVVGVIAVVVIGIVFFMGSGNTGGSAPSVQSTSAPVTQATQASSGSSVPSVTAIVTGIKAESIKEVPTATVSSTGSYVRVSYIGSFSGTYGINGEALKVKDSGDRMFPLNATTGAVTATFRKEDSSTRHDITVEIYKDGKALKFAKNSSAYGEVSVSSQV
ncbi:MAG: hypothetical protein WCH85_06500 [Methanomicrobiales archaeon]